MHLLAAIGRVASNYLGIIFANHISMKKKEERPTINQCLELKEKKQIDLTFTLVFKQFLILLYFAGSDSACIIVFMTSNGITSTQDIKPA